MNYFKFLFLVKICVSLTFAQKKVCEPLDDGPFLGTLPALNFIVDEATQNDLPGDCSTPEKYRAALRLAGTDYTLTVEGIPSLDPMSYFTKMECGGSMYLVMTTAIDRDGFTSDMMDDVSYMSARLKCQPANTDPAVVYDARFFINDVNDNVPVFPANNTPAQVAIPESTQINTVVMSVLADDKDASNLTYTLHTHNDLFSVDGMSGAVTLTSALNFETMGDNYYDLVLSVEDGGSVSDHTVTTTVRVYVTDSDDQGPAFLYQGCFQHQGVCAWPKYTTGLFVLKNQAIEVYPVPNKIKTKVTIQAYDRDLAINNPIEFSIASTIPPGREMDFTVETTKNDNQYLATVKPVGNFELTEGFEIFLKAEEQSVDKKFEIAMIYFTANPSSATSNSQGSNQKIYVGDDEDYSERELALSVVVAILATLVLCLGIALLCVMRRRHGAKEGIAMGQTNGSDGTSHRL